MTVQPLTSFDKIKLLADSRRLQILRLLMGTSLTLTQLAEQIGQSPAWIRHHVKTLERAGLVSLVEIRTTGRVREKYYKAKAGALLLEELILPKTPLHAIVFSGSHDLALQAAADHLARGHSLLPIYVGSLTGLVYLRQGLCHVSGCHLLDDAGRYNISYVHHLFPEGGITVFTLAHRTQGLIVAPGNPKSIKGLFSLARPGIRLVLRNAGSGTRLWLDRELAKQGIASDLVHTTGEEIATHTQAAAMVRLGKADAAIGLQGAATLAGLDFVPLFDERYDLAAPRANLRELSPLLDYIQTAEFRISLHSMAGYDTAHSGDQIPI